MFCKYKYAYTLPILLWNPLSPQYRNFQPSSLFSKWSLPLKRTPSVIIDLLLSICYTIQDLSQTLPGGIFMLPWLKWNPAWIVRQQLRYPHQPAQTLFVQMRVLGWKYCSVKWQNDHQAVKKKSLMATISVAEQLSTTLISYSTCNMKINSSIH